MSFRRLGLCVFATAAMVAGLWATPGSAASSAGSVPVIDDSQLKAESTTMGGAKVLPTADTIPHFFGTSLNPDNGVTYGWNMAGVDPATNRSSSIDVDIYPVVVHVAGLTFDGNNILA